MLERFLSRKETISSGKCKECENSKWEKTGYSIDVLNERHEYYECMNTDCSLLTHKRVINNIVVSKLKNAISYVSRKFAS